MMLKFLVIVAMVIAKAVPDQNYNPELQELRNGVLVQDQGFVLQGGGSAHALIKLNVTNLQFEVEKSCLGAKLLSQFVIEYDIDKKGYTTFKDVKPLVETIHDLCSYINSQMNNLLKTFKLQEPSDNDRNKRQISTVLIGSVVGTLTSSIFNSIYNALTGGIGDSKNLVGIIDNHEDRLAKIEGDLNHLNESIEIIKELVMQARSASHVMTTLQVVIHNQFLSLSALKSHLRGYYSLLNGVISPDLVSFDQMEGLYNDLEKQANLKNLKLVSDHPSEFYSLTAKYISYTNFSSQSLVVVVYLDPPVYSASNLFSLKKVIFLPLTFDQVDNVLQINGGAPVFIAGNTEKTLVQILPDLKDCSKFRNFYHCKHNGVHLKNSNNCVLSILNKKKDISKVCPFSSLGKSTKLFVEQLDDQSFVIFTGKLVDKIIFSCKTKENVNRNQVFEISTKLNSLYKLFLPEKCVADLGSHLLSSVSTVGIHTYNLINFEMFFNKKGNLTESIKDFDKKDVIKGLESINSTGDVIYSFSHLENKIKLNKLKSKTDLKNSILLYTALTSLLALLCLILFYYIRKRIRLGSYNNPNRPRVPPQVSLNTLSSRTDTDPALFDEQN